MGGSFLGSKRLQNGQKHNVVRGQICGSSSLRGQVNSPPLVAERRSVTPRCLEVETFFSLRRLRERVALMDL